MTNLGKSLTNLGKSLTNLGKSLTNQGKSLTNHGKKGQTKKLEFKLENNSKLYKYFLQEKADKREAKEVSVGSISC